MAVEPSRPPVDEPRPGIAAAGMVTGMDKPSRGSSIVVVSVLGLVGAVLAGSLWYDARWRSEPAPASAPAIGSIGPMATDSSSGAAASVTVDREGWALRLLRGWDSRRSRAWASADAAGLRRLYAAGSAAGRRDLAMLRSWRDRGLVVRGMRMQVLDLHVGALAPGRVRMVVTDRLVGAVAVRGARRLDLPRDAPTTRRLTFVRRDGRWRLAAVQVVAGSTG